MKPHHHHYVPSHQEDVPVYYPKDHTPVFPPISQHSRSAPVYFDPHHLHQDHHQDHQSLMTSYEHLYYPELHQIYQMNSRKKEPNSYTFDGFSRGYNYKHYNAKYT